MNRKQIKLCKNIQKYKRLNIILKKTKLTDYTDLQVELPLNAIHFSNIAMDETTFVTLTDETIEEIERYNDENFDKRITQFLATVGAITGIVSLIVDIMQLFL